MKSKMCLLFMLLSTHCIDATYKGNFILILSKKKNALYIRTSILFYGKQNIKFADCYIFSFQFITFLHQKFTKRNG